MTWLPVDPQGRAERDAVLDLRGEIDEHVRDTLALCWRVADPRLLDLCRLRLAQMGGARAELAGADAELLAELSTWESSSAFTERERAAIAFAEQYFLDHKLIGDDLRAELARHLSRREVVNFVWALHMNDAYARLLSLLDIEPDPPGTPGRPERTPPDEPGRPWIGQPDADAPEIDLALLQDPEFSTQYITLSQAVVRRSVVDEVTSEAVRLRNANHQGCLF